MNSDAPAKIPLTFLMLTFNEELNLGRNLPGLAAVADEVVIVDSFSTDRTLEIARAHGARIFQNKFEGHAKQWLWGMRQLDLKHDWVFMHDPDHIMTPELVEELRELFRDDGRNVPTGVDGYYVNRRNVFQGKWIRHGGYYPKYMLKVVRRQAVTFDEAEFDYRAYVPGLTLKLRHDMYEENLKECDISWWIEKHNGFATRQATEEIYRTRQPDRWGTSPNFFGNADQRVLWLKTRWYQMPLYVRPFLYYFYRYFILLGFLDGKKGFIFHFLQAFWYRLLVDIKLEQMRQENR